MAPARRAHPSSLSVPPPPGALVDLPPIAALFLIDFDVKAGYTIVWKRAAPGLELEGVVEYKSLPSGLHTVSDDLIYFVHDGTHAGLSAFVNEPCEEEEARHARMIAVGILVPLSYGRLGRAWRHAENLKQMAATLAKDRNQTEILEKYWDANKAKEGETFSTVNTPISPVPDQFRKTHGRNSSLTDGVSLFQPEHKLSPYHPAWSLAELLDRFGPLIFPIQRAALLRQRILISCHAPVHEICNFVYDISILSNIPHSIADALPQPSPPQRLRPLFNIGVHDISFLMDDLKASKRDRSDASAVDDADESGSGWIACTTDSILATKDALWDMLITMPPDHSENAKEKAWPVVEYAGRKVVKATQRDLRRFNALRTGLARLAALAPTTPGQGPPSPASETSQVRLSTSHSARVVKDEPYGGADNLVEPVTWAAFAYNGFMWWASAGEQIRSEEQEESTRDAALLADLLSPTSPRVASMSFPPGPSSPPLGEPLSNSIASLAGRRAGVDGEANIELAIITYFHRLTTQMLSVMIDIVDAADEPYHDDDDNTTDGEDDGNNDDENQGLIPNGSDESDLPTITIDSRSIEEMGLDVWSASDALFVQELAAVYFGRRAVIEGKGVEVCGVRVC
ncbi:uncharacterized protein TRIREDRAFT_107260 [Trichoderma reesei QM6a]|uniref:Predicted protein n=2 Tax=Hypocrea jecorina TaxID=51453 RepID=G0RJ74_HYPJQ|nr:uncharacterized protein TRIREDRAFT_107260 [Trichoderma reesei QM6a]EGR48538.1 predicted protein [Trichoderma reesei QM6a]ETS01389.1 hypothetical protein M419DRAFT_80563 [Trichoderma reesei RUT C-30]